MSKLDQWSVWENEMNKSSVTEERTSLIKVKEREKWIKKKDERKRECARRESGNKSGNWE